MLVVLGEKAKATSNSQENLCLRCTYYSRRKYSLDDKERRVCTSGNPEVLLRGPVSECTDFYDKTELSLRSMKEMAWTIEATKKKVGFGAEMDINIVAPSKQKKSELDDL